MDERLKKLARNLINYSCRLQPGEKVLIHSAGFEGMPLVKALVKEAYAARGVPFVDIRANDALREILLGAEEGQLALMASRDAAFMAEMDAYIGVRSSLNGAELSDVPPENMSMYRRVYDKPVHTDIRVPKTKWVVLIYPTAAAAQSAGRSSEGFEEFYYKVCNLDYARLSRAMDPLAALMERTDRVHIKGPGTDLTFSIKGIPAVKCDGRRNIPDGEIYTAPVRDSVNGVVQYNTASEYQGFTHENVRLTFENGKITGVSSNDPAKAAAVFDTDPGARYIGEFALGVNPYILNPMKSILFDEKIAGSFHFTPGASYDLAFNGNRSAVHWDLVCVQRAEYGGGEIYFDGALVRKDGMFTMPELEKLNPGGGW
jgi:aminopeptidase